MQNHKTTTARVLAKWKKFQKRTSASRVQVFVFKCWENKIHLTPVGLLRWYSYCKMKNFDEPKPTTTIDIWCLVNICSSLCAVLYLLHNFVFASKTCTYFNLNIYFAQMRAAIFLSLSSGIPYTVDYFLLRVSCSFSLCFYCLKFISIFAVGLRTM